MISTICQIEGLSISNLLISTIYGIPLRLDRFSQEWIYASGGGFWGTSRRFFRYRISAARLRADEGDDSFIPVFQARVEGLARVIHEHCCDNGSACPSYNATARFRD